MTKDNKDNKEETQASIGALVKKRIAARKRKLYTAIAKSIKTSKRGKRKKPAKTSVKTETTDRAININIDNSKRSNRRSVSHPAPLRAAAPASTVHIIQSQPTPQPMSYLPVREDGGARPAKAAPEAAPEAAQFTLETPAKRDFATPDPKPSTFEDALSTNEPQMQDIYSEQSGEFAQTPPKFITPVPPVRTLAFEAQAELERRKQRKEEDDRRKDRQREIIWDFFDEHFPDLDMRSTTDLRVLAGEYHRALDDLNKNKAPGEPRFEVDAEYAALAPPRRKGKKK